MDMDIGFKDYMALTKPLLDKSLKQQQDHFKTVLEPLYDIAIVHSYLFDQWQESQPKEPRALYTIGALVTQMAMGIHAALSVGAAFSAGVQFRTVFELLLSAKLICETDTQARSDLYLNFS